MVNEPTQVAVSLTSTPVICNGDATGTATAVGSGGIAPYSYLWSNGETTAIASGLAAGYHTVTVADSNGCSITDSIMVNQPTPVDVALNATSIYCYGDSTGTATAAGSGGIAPYTYMWSNGETTATISSLVAGTYTVTVSDSNLCTYTDSVTVNGPASALAIAMSSTNILCYGQANGTATGLASGGTASYTYLWNTGQTSSTITGLLPGTYTVTATDANGCSITDSVVITQPAILHTWTSTTNVACNGNATGTATSHVTGGTMPYAYSWSGGGQTTATATGLAAGYYLVTVTDANGCTAMATAVISQPTALVATATPGTILVNGGTTSVTVTAAGGIAPYTGTGTFTNVSAGTHSYTVTDANGCSSTSTITITQPSLFTALTVTAFIEGYYIPGSNPPAMSPACYNNQTYAGGSSFTTSCVDSVTVELVDVNYVAQYSATGMLQTNGTLNVTFNASAAGGSYYIRLIQQNSVSLWSSALVTMSGTNTYNFSTSMSSAATDGFNAPMATLAPGLYGLYSGDINKDGFIDAADYSNFTTDANQFSNNFTFFLPSDLNGDGFVDAFDYPVYSGNSNSGVYEQYPY
jgi:hypothetical protein